VDISLSSEDQEDTSWIDCSDELSKNCFSQFGELRKSGHLTDVIIKVEGREIPAHRIILAATIPFFNAMFTCEMIEAYSNVITLPSLFFLFFLNIYGGGRGFNRKLEIHLKSFKMDPKLLIGLSFSFQTLMQTQWSQF